MVNYLLFVFFIAIFSLIDLPLKGFGKGLLISFFLIFIFAAIRYDFGYDYLMYKREFRIINSIEKKNWPVGMNRLEVGWIYLNKLFKFANFSCLIVFLSFIYNFIFYLFIKNILDRKLHAISLLFFLLIPGAFIYHQSLLRQSIALSFFITAIILVNQRVKLMWSILPLFFACFFHASALILIPVFFTKYLNLSKNYAYVIGVLYLLLFFLSYTPGFSTLVFDFINRIFPKYSHYLNPESNSKIKVNTGLGVFFSAANFLLLLFFRNKFLQKESMKIIYFCSVIFYFISPLVLISGHFQRLNMYFEVFLIITIPMIFSFINNKKIKYIYLFLCTAFYIHSLMAFFKSDMPEQKFNTYKTIF